MNDATLHERRFTVGVSPEDIVAVQAALAEAVAGRLPAAALFRLSMAIEELITNVEEHGGGPETAVAVAILVGPAQVTVELRDGGPAFDPFDRAPPASLDLPLEDRPIGGLGLHLIRKMVDSAIYRREGEENVVRLEMRSTMDGSQG